MKKFLLFGLLAFAVVLTGCSEKQEILNEDGDKKITANETFKKKQECAGYYNQVLDETKNNRGTKREFTIDEIFYSPIKNSCIGVISLYEDTSDGYSFVESRIYDILSKNREDTKSVCNGGVKCTEFNSETSISKKQQGFDKKIQELKGE